MKAFKKGGPAPHHLTRKMNSLPHEPFNYENRNLCWEIIWQWYSLRCPVLELTCYLSRMISLSATEFRSPLDHDMPKMAIWYTHKIIWKRCKNVCVPHFLRWYILRCSRDGRQEAEMKLETRKMEGTLKKAFRGLTFLWGPICVCSLQYTFSHKCFSSCALLRSVANEADSMYRLPHWRCLIDSHVLQALTSQTSRILSPEDGTWQQASKVALIT